MGLKSNPGLNTEVSKSLADTPCNDHSLCGHHDIKSQAQWIDAA